MQRAEHCIQAKATPLNRLPVIARDRDIRLLRGLFESRVMTSGHAAALYFENNYEVAKKRLQKLKAAALIGERPRRVFELSVLFLARRGLALLQERGVLAEYPPLGNSSLERRALIADSTVPHELEVIDVKVAFHRGIKQKPVFSIAEFSTWPLLHEFNVYHPGRGGAEVTIKPDGFIRFTEQLSEDEKYERSFFLELDRSTEIQEKLVNKAVCYFEYYRSGGFAERSGGLRDAFKKYPFRVLIVCKNAERRNNAAMHLLQCNPPIAPKHTYLSTLSEVIADPFGPVWLTPAAYRDAVSGTPFDVERPHQAQAYRRQSERELYVERHAVKCPLLL